MNESRLEKRLRWAPKAGDMVEVEWTDSYYDTSADASPEDYSAHPARLMTLGYFVKRSKDGLVVSMCRDTQSGTMRHFVTIPRVNVKGMWPCSRTEAKEA